MVPDAKPPMPLVQSHSRDSAVARFPQISRPKSNMLTSLLDLVHDVAGRLRVGDVVDHDVGARRAQSLSHASPDARAGPGHERLLPPQRSGSPCACSPPVHTAITGTSLSDLDSGPSAP